MLIGELLRSLVLVGFKGQNLGLEGVRIRVAIHQGVQHKGAGLRVGTGSLGPSR